MFGFSYEILCLLKYSHWIDEAIFYWSFSTYLIQNGDLMNVFLSHNQFHHTTTKPVCPTHLRLHNDPTASSPHHTTVCPIILLLLLPHSRHNTHLDINIEMQSHRNPPRAHLAFAIFKSTRSEISDRKRERERETNATSRPLLAFGFTFSW